MWATRLYGSNHLSKNAWKESILIKFFAGVVIFSIVILSSIYGYKQAKRAGKSDTSWYAYLYAAAFALICSAILVLLDKIGWYPD